MERKTQLEPLSTARKKKDLLSRLPAQKRKTPSLTGDEVSKLETTPEEAERYWQILPPAQAENAVSLASAS